MRRDAFVHYMTGVPEMDAQHWAMIEMLAEIDALGEFGCGNEIATKLNELLEFMTKHRGEEEELMKKIGFPFVASHKQEHLDLLRKLRDMTNRAERGQCYAHGRMMDALRDLLMKHIDHQDMQYAPYYQQFIQGQNQHG